MRLDHPLVPFVAVMLLAGGFGLWTDSLYLLQVATFVGIYAIVAIGLNLLLGTAGQISLGHAAFFAIGAYTGTLLMLRLAVALPLAVIAAGLVSGICGLLIGYIALRFKGHYLAMVTLAFGLIVYALLREIPWLDGGPGHAGIPSLAWWSFDFTSPRGSYYFVWALVALAYLAGLSLLHSRVGRALEAIREDDLAAAAMGVDVSRYKIKVFTLSAIYAGVAGAIYASFMGVIVFNTFEPLLSIYFLIMVVLGGLGSIPGAILGVAAFTLLQEAGRAWENYRLAGMGLMLVLLVVFLPRGLAGLIHGLAAALPGRGRPARATLPGIATAVGSEGRVSE